ncbi:methyltransferase, FkbM family [Frankia sp. EI5c]|nr:methyltransferase, FkbM family [Frankia sp. EI5c]
MKVSSVVAGLIPDRAFGDAIALAHRRFEPVLGQIRSLVAPGQTVLDVGGWYGPWTFWLSRIAHRVVTVEANPELAAFIARVASPNVTVIAKAASDQAGTATLSLPPGGRGTEGRASLGELPGGRSVTVETFRLDSLELDDVGLIKIDVEGHELSALRGAEGIIQKWRPNLLVEIEEARSPAAPTIEYLYDFGYKGLVLVGGRWIPLDEFDLIGHQKAMSGQPEHGYLRAVIDGSGAKFVNNVLFRYPRGQFAD